jgi:hypothetical protein
MFRSNKKRSVQVTLVKTPKTGEPDEDKKIHPDTVNLVTEKTKDVVKFLALTAIVAYGAVKAIDTMSEVVIKKTKSADNNEK